MLKKSKIIKSLLIDEILIFWQLHAIFWIQQEKQRELSVKAPHFSPSINLLQTIHVDCWTSELTLRIQNILRTPKTYPQSHYIQANASIFLHPNTKWLHRVWGGCLSPLHMLELRSYDQFLIWDSVSSLLDVLVVWLKKKLSKPVTI